MTSIVKDVCIRNFIHKDNCEKNFNHNFSLIYIESPKNKKIPYGCTYKKLIYNPVDDDRKKMHKYRYGYY